MTITIKVKDEDKRRLDELKAKLLINGIKLNQEELLSKLLDLGENYMLELDNIPMIPLNNKKKKEILSRSYHLGESSEQTVDPAIYGE